MTGLMSRRAPELDIRVQYDIISIISCAAHIAARLR